MKWRILFAAVILAAAGWSGWWFIGAAAHDRALRGWLEERRAAGWQAEVASLATVGFPNRFDTRLEGLALADPSNGWAWEAPFLDILMLSWRPNAAVVALGPEQTLAFPGARTRLRSEALRGSARLMPGLSMALSRVSVEGAELTLAAEAGWRAGVRRLEAHVRQAQPGQTPPNGYDVYLALEDVLLPAFLRLRLDPAGALPERAQTARIDAQVALDRPLDRHALEQAPPQIAALSLKALEARWGELALTASGQLRADERGFAEGRIAITARNWRRMLQAAVAGGALDADLARLIEQALGFIARLTGGEAIEATLSFSGGTAWLGPAPLGRAPRLMNR